MRISDWSSDVCSSDLAPGGTDRHPDAASARRDALRAIWQCAFGRFCAAAPRARHCLPAPWTLTARAHKGSFIFDSEGLSMRNSFLFTSESVSEGHPDKVSDQISDSIVDLFLSKDPEARVACETLTTTQQIGRAHV